MADERRITAVRYSPSAKLLVKKDGPVKLLRELRGRTVVVTAAPPNAAVQALGQRLGITFVSRAEHKQSFALFASAAADAFQR
jgi:hypothetical protein